MNAARLDYLEFLLANRVHLSPQCVLDAIRNDEDVDGCMTLQQVDDYGAGCAVCGSVDRSVSWRWNAYRDEDVLECERCYSTRSSGPEP